MLGWVRRLLKCWMSDAYYDADQFEKTLKLVFGVRTRIFDSRLSPTNTKVAVTATTISDARPYVFSNYNGSGQRQRECGELICIVIVTSTDSVAGYQHVRPPESKDEPRIWEA